MIEVSMVKNYSKQSGVTLVEVMVSVFIFAIGVLGFASLQTRSIQGGFDNNQREQVVLVSESLVDRIKANSANFNANPAANANGYVANLTAFTVDDCATVPVSCAQTSGTDTAMDCDAGAIADFDVWDVLCSNNFQGINTTKELQVDLDCKGACVDGGLTLVMTWCAQTGQEDTEDCDGLSQMGYTVDFVP